ncbi:unnamed protein product, partial [Staurois parvus]
CQLSHVISCVQSQLITDHQGTDDQCSPSSASCQCPSMPHISAHLSCLSVSPISASQCHLSMPISTSQCRLSVPYISAAFQCCLSMPISNAHQCHLSVLPISAAYQ